MGNRFPQFKFYSRSRFTPSLAKSFFNTEKAKNLQIALPVNSKAFLAGRKEQIRYSRKPSYKYLHFTKCRKKAPVGLIIGNLGEESS